MEVRDQPRRKWLALLKNTPERVERSPDETDKTRQQIIALLNLARAYDWQIAIIVGGGIDHEHGHELILGEVIGGDESHWRSFADRATDAQLQEAAQILQAAASANEMGAA
jgi:hypothetical protein